MHERRAKEVGVPQGYSFEEASGGIEAYRLDANGLQVLLCSGAAAPVVAFMITYRVGSRHEPEGLTGATHFLEHLMFKGTERFNRRNGRAVFRELQRVGAQMNATTWLDRTNYYAVLPREWIPMVVEIEADRMRGALINEEDVESERTVILNELDRGENDPVRKLNQELWQAAFAVHPYRHPTIGWRGDVEQATPAGLRHFYDAYYWPDNATVSVIGDFDRAEVLRLIGEHFGGIVRHGEAPPAVQVHEPAQREERRVTLKRAGQVGAVIVAWKAPRGLDVDADALDLLCAVLSSGKSSRLYRRLMDEGIVASASSGVSRFLDPGLMMVLARPAPGRTHEEVEKALHAVIDEIKENGITDEELHRAHVRQRAQEAFGRDGPLAVASRLNEAIAVGNWTFHTTLRQRIEHVAREDVQDAARRYLVARARTVGYYVPEG